jgi:plastocyanin
MQRSLWAAALAALTLTISASLTVASCGGGSPDSPSPSPAPAPAPAPNPTPPPGSSEVRTTTIAISAAGVSPKDIVVERGSRVTFTNSDNIGHDMNSDPHPFHTECPEINVGFFGNGQTGVTQPLNTARTCRYHDHNQPTVAALQGSIRIE